MATRAEYSLIDFLGVNKPINVAAPVNNGDVMRKDEFGINYNKLGVSGNPDFASIASLSTPLSAAYGGTGQLGGYTAGDILYASGASTLSTLAKPTNTGMVLSGGSTPAWVSGATLLASATASSSATIDFNFTNWTNADYIAYFIVFANVLPATNSVQLYLRTSANGTSFDSGAGNYGWTNTDFGTGSFSASDTQVKISGTTTGLSNSAADGTSGCVWVHRPSAATNVKIVSDTAAKGPSQIRRQFSSGERLSAAAVNGLRFLFSSGNIASGEFRLFGLGTT